jgi:hypothetical protein
VKEAVKTIRLLLAGCKLELIFGREVRGNTFLRKVGR